MTYKLTTNTLYTFICFLTLTLTSQNSIAGTIFDNIQSKSRIIACADPYNWPLSSSSDYPKGVDIDLAEKIAHSADLSLDIYWADTGTRGGLGKALRNSISKGRCHFFLGIGMDTKGEAADELAEKDLVFTIPYTALAYVPVVNNSLPNVNSLKEILDSDQKIGVTMATLADGYFIYNNSGKYKDRRELFLKNRQITDALAKKQINAALVWSSGIPKALRKHKDANLRIISFDPPEELMWNLGIAVPKEDEELLNFLNKGITELIDNGGMQSIVQKYNMPYFPPM